MKESKDYVENEMFRLKKQAFTFANSLLGLAFLHYSAWLLYNLYQFITG
jgi:hypothetical protein